MFVAKNMEMSAKYISDFEEQKENKQNNTSANDISYRF